MRRTIMHGWPTCGALPQRSREPDGMTVAIRVITAGALLVALCAACAPQGYGFGQWNLADPADAFRLRPLGDCPPPQTVAECQQRGADAAAQAKLQQEAQAQHQASVARAMQDDASRGYQRISVETFVLDGRDLAARAAKVSISGAYVREGFLEALYADTRAIIMATRYPNAGGQNQPKVLLLTDDASRDFRQHLLTCQSNAASAQVGCSVRVLGQATICTLSNAFGAARELPCVAVEAGQ